MSETTTLAEFMEKVHGWNEEGERVLGVANAEYAQDESKFNNFHITATIMNHVCPELKGLIKPEHVIMIFQLKHLFSIWGGVSLRESMEGRYTDAGNYLHLHRGVREECISQEEASKQATISVKDRQNNMLAVLDELNNVGALKDASQELVDAFWAARRNVIEGQI